MKSVFTQTAVFGIALCACGVARGAGLTSQSYVQDGLVAQLDAIENVGVGQAHDAAATVWKDLKGSASLTVLTGAAWGERVLDMQKVPHRIVNMPAFYLDSCSTEVTMNLVEGKPSGYRRIFTVDASQEGLYNVYVLQNANSSYLYINGKGSRPGFGGVTCGTLATACATNYCYTYGNAVAYGSGGSSGSLGASAGHVAVASCGWTIQGYGGGEIHGQYAAFRHYDRPLSQDELAYNALVDRLRFFSFAFRGDGTAVNWADLAWAKPVQVSATAPAAGFTEHATLANAAVAVTASDTVELAGLSLEDGATLAIAAGGAVTVRELFVEGVRMTRGVYTAAGGYGTPADWISGAGEVRVTGSYATTITKPMAGLGPLSYVQDGLIAQFDAVDNEGTGTHNPAAATWRDLAGSASVTLSGNAKWIDRALDSAASNQNILNMPAFYYNSVFTELAVKIVSHAGAGTFPRLFFHTSGDNYYSVYHQANNDQMFFFLGQQSDIRPCFYFSNGTLSLGSDRTNIRTYVNGTMTSSSGSYAFNHAKCPANTWNLDRNGQVPSHFRSIRHYNRALTQAEIDHNRQIDIQRFESYLCTGDGSATNWSEIAWFKPERGGEGDAPSGATNEYATVANASVQVAATDAVALAGLSLERGATLDVAAGAAVSLKLLYVSGTAVARGVYTADGRDHTTAADWVTGAGEVRVAGGLDRGVPSIPVPDADGWYTFGLMEGKCDQKWIVGERPIWDNYIFPPGAKLRLKGWLLLDTVPDVFTDYDTTQLKRVFVNGTRAYAADRPFEVPAGIIFRFAPGDWKSYANNSNAVANLNYTSMSRTTGDVTLAKYATFHVWGDGLPNLTYSGLLSGTGILSISSYGRQMRFTGGFACDAEGGNNWQNGTGIWIDTLAVTSSLQTVTLASCGDSHGMTHDYSASYVMFGKAGSAAPADHPLHIARLNGNASSRVDADGKRWRSGGHLLVWGSNTVHVGALHAGLHVVASRRDQDCSNGFLNESYNTSGTGGLGFLTVDAFNTGTIYGSTNVALTVGTVAANAWFDYTYQSNAVNRLTLDITNSCDSSSILKATDLAMLPARVSGFTGNVTLTDTAARSYTMPIDFTAGPDGLYNTVGCIGSGTLAAAPATGTIDVTFPTSGIEPVRGRYALARFTAGGERLAGWTVTLNGEAAGEARIGRHVVTVRRDATGLWLGVDQPGSAFIVR